MALNLDLPATFLDWAEVAIPASYQGNSLKSLIEGDVEPDGWREDFFCEHFNPRYSMSWEGVRGERFKYARYLDQDPPTNFFTIWKMTLMSLSISRKTRSMRPS